MIDTIDAARLEQEIQEVMLSIDSIMLDYERSVSPAVRLRFAVSRVRLMVMSVIPFILHQ